MTLRSALYYPHTRVNSEELLKSALLYWDELYVIAPWEGYEPDYESRGAAEAFSVIGRCHYPTEAEKMQAHEIVLDFVERPLPSAFMYHSEASLEDMYSMYPKKLLPETWKILEDARMAMGSSGPRGVYASRSTGYSLMSIIADCCAGETLNRVTDKGEAYANIAGLLTEQPSPQLALDEAREQLIPVPLTVLDLRNLSLETLIDLRKRENAAADGHQIRDLRHRLVDVMDAQAQSLAKASSDLEREALIRGFEKDMQDDFRNLRDALKASSWQTLFSKEVLTAVLLGVGAIGTAALTPAFPIAGVLSATEATVSIGGLLATKSKLAQERQKVLREHPTAYWYEAVGGLRL